MSADEPRPDVPAEPVVRPRRLRVSPVWAIPIVALVVAAWLGFVTFAEHGPRIVITFRTGEGLEAGKTRVKHNDVELGIVDKVELSPDLSHVIVTASMNRSATAHLASGTRFWVVRPRISLGNLSGLETLVSGAYVEMDPGEGDAERNFVGLEDPPVVRAGVPGREFILASERLGSIGPDTPLYYRSVRVGEVLGYEFSPTGADIRIHAFVNAPYDRLVHDGSRFWNDSGVTISAGTSGFKVEVESLQAVLAGGIGFETPVAARDGEPSKEGTVFHLYPDRTSIIEANYFQRVPFIVEFDGSVHGLEIGAPVEFRGIKVGNVTDIRLEFDPDNNRIRIPVTLDFEPQRIERRGTATGETSDPARVMAVMNELVARGMRAQLRSTSLITGQLVVAFDFFPNAPPAKIALRGTTPELPSVPSDLESLTVSLTDLLSHMAVLVDRVTKMPLEDLVQDTRSVLQSLKSLVSAPEIRDSVRALDKTLTDADASLHQLDTLVASATTGYGGDSQVRRGMLDLLRQLQDTAKSVQLLADYVEQHPEALLRGKGAPP